MFFNSQAVFAQIFARRCFSQIWYGKNLQATAWELMFKIVFHFSKCTSIFLHFLQFVNIFFNLEIFEKFVQFWIFFQFWILCSILIFFSILKTLFNFSKFFEIFSKFFQNFWNFSKNCSILKKLFNFKKI